MGGIFSINKGFTLKGVEGRSGFFRGKEIICTKQGGKKASQQRVKQPLYNVRIPPN